MANALLNTLLDAAGDWQVMPADDLALVGAAEQWLTENGWELHYSRGWSNVGRAFTADDEPGLVIRERRRGFWDAEGVRHPVPSVGGALNVLANVGILPSRFSTLGRDALRDFGEALERAAERLDEDTSDRFLDRNFTSQDRILAFAKADGLRAAAAVARENNPLAVFV